MLVLFDETKIDRSVEFVKFIFWAGCYLRRGMDFLKGLYCSPSSYRSLCRVLGTVLQTGEVGDAKTVIFAINNTSMKQLQNVWFITLLLSSIAGYCDTATFVAADRIFSAHVTGNFIVFAYQMVNYTDVRRLRWI
jgi:Protein of unknown function (DUF1275)